MPVYVDDMRATFGRMIMCHLIADTDEELRAFATLIGLKDVWHQGDHFDISLSKRKLAVLYGAREISRRALSCMAMNRRNGWPIGTPDTAEAITQERMNYSRTGKPRYETEG